MPSFLRRLLLTLIVALFVGALPGHAQAQSTPRGAEHETFGRMVFDWSGPVQWSASVADGKLTARFDKPIAGDTKALVKALPKYVKAVAVAPDRRSAVFTLSRPIQLKTFESGNSTVVDMIEDKSAPPAQPAAPPVQAAPPSAPTLPATDIMVRGGEHTGFNRLVFDWPKAVGYTVADSDGQAVIAFDRPANVNMTALAAALPSDVRVVETKPQGKGTAVVLALAPGMRVRHFTNGAKIAVDLVRAAGSPPPTHADGSPPPPLAPAPDQSEKLPVANTAPPAAAPAKPLPAPPPTETAAPAKTQAPAASPPPEAPKTATPLPAPPPGGVPVVAAPPMPAAADAPRPAAVSLGVPFDQPTGAAAYRRAGWLWLVFDRKTEVDTKLLRRSGGDVVTFVEQVPNVRGGTAIRLLARAGFNPSVRKEGQLWVFDLTEQPLAPKAPLVVNRQFDFEDRGRLLIPVADAPQKPVVFRDPEIGDIVQVMPLPGIGFGIRDGVSAPAVELPATAQGVVVLPQSESVHIDGDRSGLEVSMPGGLYLSRDLPAMGGGGGGEAALTSAGGPADLARWMRGGLDQFVPEQQKLMARMAYVRPEERNAQRLELARHYLANGMGQEALGIADLIARSDPPMVDTPNFRAVRGIAHFAAHHDAEAEADLSHPSLAKDPQAQLWLAAARSRASLDHPERQALALRLAPEDMKAISPRLRLALGAEAVRSTLAAGDTKAASRIIEAMNGPGLGPRDSGTIARLQGNTAQASKQWDQAISKYREAEESESRPDRAYAGRERIELQLQRGMISTADAINELEKLRFAWRGEDFEYQLLKRLGELMIADGRFAQGLRSMRATINNYPDHPDIPNVQKAMADTFEKLYLDGGADAMSPIAAIGLYDEFQELTPSGTKGDEMIRKLADRLAAVDLLDRSAELLTHQVQYRLEGAEKARVGARLAFLQLSDRKPGAALDSLDASEVANQPPDLYNQRRYLRVRALADLGRAAEALALIVNDQSDDAKRLRAEIFWDQKRWPEAAAALEDQIQPPFGNMAIDPKTARQLVDLATALTLARDERGLARLRKQYEAKMNKTEFREAFSLLTAEPERGVIDPNSVAAKIKEVQSFQGFMADWTKRMQTQGLSAVN